MIIVTWMTSPSEQLKKEDVKSERSTWAICTRRIVEGAGSKKRLTLT